MSDLDNFIGCWRLVSAIRTSASGIKVNAWGEDPIGYLIYSKAGIMSAQIMRRLSSKDDHLIITQEYLAYSGRYEVDEINKIITHKVELSIDKHVVGTLRKRQYQFLDNYRVQLKALEYLEEEYVLIWEHVFGAEI